MDRSVHKGVAGVTEKSRHLSVERKQQEKEGGGKGRKRRGKVRKGGLNQGGEYQTYP